MDKNQPNQQTIEYQSVQTLKGVGPSVAKKLALLNIKTIQDVMFHLPLRYEDRTKITPIGTIKSGDAVLIEGIIEYCEIKFMGRGKRSLSCQLVDNTGSIRLRFFYFNKLQQAKLIKGTILRCFGTTRNTVNYREMIHPEYKVITNNSEIEPLLTPIYPKTEDIHQSLLTRLSTQVLEIVKQGDIDDYLPETLIKKHQFPNLKNALFAVHRPDKNTEFETLKHYQTKAQQRLLFEELLAHQLSLLTVRYQIKQTKAYALTINQSFINDFNKKFGFTLTHAQTKVIEEIINDIKTNVPMLRLVQGDVGSGKTAVAAVAAKITLVNKKQIAIMAPTEILAQQHYHNFCTWFDKENCLLLTGKDKGKKRQQKLNAIEQAQVNIIIGTHALFQDDVKFKSLALLVVDEQHRFGVEQRLALRSKGLSKNYSPHQLIMTATPIPRSLAMTAYADLDYSVINELPQGRKPINTVIISNLRREEVITRVANACNNNQQAYWVCTLVDESELLQCEAAEVTAEKLQNELTNLKIGLVHGRMKADEKQKIITQFKNKEIDILVATTVIEVGVDVPDASLMVIENAERLGLAQLHQLRGRVGRGEKQSACVLLYQAPLSVAGKKRLQIIRQSNDGFFIAEQDLKLRGPGELLGIKQTGIAQLKIADIIRDEAWFNEVRDVSQIILKQYPDKVSPLITRWLGQKNNFASV